jgi:hypothetical protein
MHDPHNHNKPSAGVKQYYVAASTDEGKIVRVNSRSRRSAVPELQAPDHPGMWGSGHARGASPSPDSRSAGGCVHFMQVKVPPCSMCTALQQFNHLPKLAAGACCWCCCLYSSRDSLDTVVSALAAVHGFQLAVLVSPAAEHVPQAPLTSLLVCMCVCLWQWGQLLLGKGSSPRCS